MTSDSPYSVPPDARGDVPRPRSAIPPAQRLVLRLAVAGLLSGLAFPFLMDVLRAGLNLLTASR